MSDDSGDARPVVVLLEAGAAAGRVGVSASGLRRLATIYEAVHGELPRKPNSHNRLWPQDAVDRLKVARQMVEREQCRTILEALEALQRGVGLDDLELEPRAARVAPDATQRALEVLTMEVRQLRQELAEMKQLPHGGTPVQKQPPEQEHGLMVRAALWIERQIRRFRG